jgi:hypothetical protein
MAVVRCVERVSSRGISSVLRFLPAFQRGEFRTSEMLECPEDDCDCLPPTIRSRDEIELSMAVETATKSLQDTLRNWGARRRSCSLRWKRSEGPTSCSL